VVINVKNILVLGSYIISLNYFPSYIATSRINIGGFLQRLEALVSTAFLISGFIKISICLLGAANGISKLFNFNDYRFLVMPSALIILNLSFIDYKDSMELAQWANNIYPYYAFIFEVILPVMVLIGARIKLRKANINNL
jgi:Spore germination protein.